MERYEKKGVLGEGTWGIVTEAIQRSSGRQVAIKRIRAGNAAEGVNFTALREIKLLQEIKHPNIIELVDVFIHQEQINLVFEYCTTDLETIVLDREGVMITDADVKCHMVQLLRAIEHCHAQFILHRDLKPSNLLYTPGGVMKLADFGLARLHGSPNRLMTPTVVTRWYRPPELCFQSREYGPAVDMWAIGCIFAELILRRPLLAGSSDFDQLVIIFQVFGTPTQQNWQDHDLLPDYMEFQPQPPMDLRKVFPAIGDDAFDLMTKMLVLNPSSRISASDALAHPYFSNSPEATDCSKLPLPVPKDRRARPEQ